MTWSVNVTGHTQDNEDQEAAERRVADRFREFLNGLPPEDGLLSATFNGNVVSQDLRQSEAANQAEPQEEEG